ncbi:Inositol-1,4,5-trisphosphate 5-phosphatase 1 [Cyphellophora attinorum]|uniref:phosphoinositide 5-phosphatase n=1 Tax=Cyphellophora attinorum TaxID=1664694 RepID=A0A0N1GXY5_9EURO|nr:Inositol-1,4,5-trisphosphate 5-phosphatase 1 [Phialophora attinorum]KPI35313.1 Inositol-1,4,5-trisphosphate 5-phosphatase 1 [Phialophora attinorum]
MAFSSTPESAKSMKVLINDYPHRTIAIATDTHALIFRHTHDGNRNPSATSLSLNSTTSGRSPPRCMAEFGELSNFDLTEHRNVAAARGTLGVITLNNDVFLCVVTGSVEVASLRPGETIQRIYGVEFFCLNRSDYDHSHGGHVPNPLPGREFDSGEFDYGSGADNGETFAEHPFHALQKLLSGGNFYYSVDFDLTRRLQDRANDASLDIATLDDSLLWNSYMINPLLEFRNRLTHHEREKLDGSRILTSVIRGFARTLTVPPSSTPIRRKLSNMPASITVISRLSSRRAGTRFNSRGIDDNGNVANFVETETIFWSPTGLCFSYVQVRGSVPLFWESSSTLIPGQQKIQITRSPEATQPSFDKHFSGLEANYGAIHIVNLLSNSKAGEADLTARYREHVKRSPLRRHDPNEEEDHDMLRVTEFDFHEYAKGAAGYDVARALRPFIDLSAESFVYFLSEDIEEWTTSNGKPKKFARSAVIMQQNGVFRVNCLDCLDRTNLVQGMLSKLSLELFLSHRAEKANGDFWMRHDTLWADNGDALSKIYAGTGALKSSFTRHGKMSLGGALADVRKSATRLYVNHFEDKGRQNTVDLLLGRLVGQSSVDLFDPVNDWVVHELGKRRIEFESCSAVKVFVGTFNLNGKTGGTREDLSAWLRSAPGFDLVVVGFQEIVDLSPQQIMSTDPNRRMVWESAVRTCLNGSNSEKQQAPGEDEYVLLRSGQLVGAALLIFVKAPLLARISNVEGAIKKTGMSGIAGNKGAVAIRMEIDSTSVCFVTAHLAAGFGNYDERNRDYHTITSGLHFQRDRRIEDHEVIVWAGDFNYRVGLSHDSASGLVQQAMTGNTKHREDALGRLYENDQLNIQMVAGNCFDFYREGRIAFLPTYKYDIGKDEYDSSEKARIPAWTDRVLWKVNHQHSMSGGGGEDLSTQVKQLKYDSVQSIRVSDHRPVYAIFEMSVRVVDEAKKDALTRKLYQKRAREVKTAANMATEGEDDDSDDLSSDIEDTVGYEAIEAGLPPASSDKRKWWLDNNRTVRADIKPPAKDSMLNPQRKSNPWSSAATGAEDDDWIQVEKPSTTSNGNGAAKVKPEPPPPRNTSNAAQFRSGDARVASSSPASQQQAKQRMLPPAWEGERFVSSSTATDGPAPALPARVTSNGTGLLRSASTATKTPPPQPPVPRNSTPTPFSRQDRTASIASTTSSASYATPPSTSAGPTSNASGVLKRPPPKPTKPSVLAATSAEGSASNSRTVSASSTGTVLTKPILGANVPLTDSSRSSSVASNSNGALRKPVPPLPPQPSSSSSAQRQPSTQLPAVSENEGNSDRPPPPLPRRTGTGPLPTLDTGTSNRPQIGLDGTRETTSGPPVAKPLVKQRKGSYNNNNNMSSPISPIGFASTGEYFAAQTGSRSGSNGTPFSPPVLPARSSAVKRGGNGVGLMDQDESEGLKEWEVLTPRAHK